MIAPELDEATIFNTARRIAEPDARRLYLQEACGEDRNLHDRVRALLRIHEEEGSLLQAPAVGQAFQPDVLATSQAGKSDLQPGTQIGHYKLVEQIGEGGFGVVFMAEQQRPVRRLVAV